MRQDGGEPRWGDEPDIVRSLWRGVVAGQMEVFAPAKASSVNDPDLGPRCQETQRRRRGHAFHLPKAERTRIPRLGATESAPTPDKTIHAHCFVGGADWCIPEADWSTGEAFGYADLGFGDPEWGSISLPEVEEVAVGRLRQPVERDMCWAPQRFADIRRPAT